VTTAGLVGSHVIEVSDSCACTPDATNRRTAAAARPLKLLTVLDEYIREYVAIEARRSMKAH
jgi:hypothetical protein